MSQDNTIGLTVEEGAPVIHKQVEPFVTCEGGTRQTAGQDDAEKDPSRMLALTILREVEAVSW